MIYFYDRYFTITLINNHMKKVFTIIAIITLTVSAYAQQIPNGGFETWTSPLNPDYWSTIATAYGAQFESFATRDTTTGNHVQGVASLKLFSDSVPGQGALFSQAGLGKDSTLNNLTFFGFPYTKRPDSLFFFVKYTPGIAAAIDSGSLQFNLTQAGVSLFGGYGFVPLTNTAAYPGQWAEIVIPLSTYYSSSVTGAPDTLVMIFSSGNVEAQQTVYGSTLWIDSVHFDASVIVSGIADLNGPVMGVRAYPNPATDQINIAIQPDEVGSRIQLIDMQGRVVYSSILDSTNDAIDTRSLQPGVYAIHVNSIDHLTTYKGQITVTK